MVSRNIFSKMYLPKVVFGHLFLYFFQNPKKVLEKKVNYFTYSIYLKGLKTTMKKDGHKRAALFLYTLIYLM